jgi:serine/alanine adding enzyme
MDVVTDVPADAWRDFLASTPGASIFQTPEMSRVYGETKGYRPQVVALETGGQIRGLMLSAVISFGAAAMSRVTGRTICVGGPLGDAAALPGLLAAHDAIALRRSLLTQIRNLDAPSERSVFERSGYLWEDHLNFIVDLTKGEPTLWAAMSKARRKGISLGERSGLDIRNLNLDELGQGYSLLRETYRRVGVPLADISLFRSGYEILVRQGILWVMAATLHGAPCAVRFVLCWQRTLYDWYAGSNNIGRDAHADEWLLWEILKRGITQGCQLFDFGGAGPPGEPYGPGEFKRRFGGKEVHPGRWERVYHPLTARAAKVSYALWRHLA